MTNTLSLDYLRGEIPHGVPFRIVVMISYDSYNTSGIFSQTSTDLKSGDENWGVLGVEEKYTNFADIYPKPFYFQSQEGLFYYPVYLDSSKGYNFTVDGYTFYYNPADTYPDGSSIDEGSTEKPSKFIGYRSYEIIASIPLYVFGIETNDTENEKGYFYPLYLEPIESIPYHEHTFEEYPGIIFYMKDSDGVNHHADQPPDEAQCVVYNNYDTISDTLFKFNQTPSGNITLEVVTTGNYSNSADKYKYLGLDENRVLTPYENNNSTEFNLIPYYNLSNLVIYSGGSYKLKNSSESIKLKFIDNIVKGNDTLIDNLSGQYSGTPSTDRFMGEAENPDHLDLYTLDSDFITFFFVPFSEATLSLTTHNLITYDDFTVTDYILMYIHDVDPIIRDKVMKFKKNSGQVYSGEIAQSPNKAEAMSGRQNRYCSENENCGSCVGVCANISNGSKCMADSVSKDKPPNEYFTCDPERFYESSGDIKKTTIETHSKTIIVIVLAIIVAIFAGIVLYEERKTILKEFYKLKNGL